MAIAKVPTLSDMFNRLFFSKQVCRRKLCRGCAKDDKWISMNEYDSGKIRPKSFSTLWKMNFAFAFSLPVFRIQRLFLGNIFQSNLCRNERPWQWKHQILRWSLSSESLAFYWIFRSNAVSVCWVSTKSTQLLVWFGRFQQIG